MAHLLTWGKMRTRGWPHRGELSGSGSGLNTSSTADASCTFQKGNWEWLQADQTRAAARARQSGAKRAKVHRYLARAQGRQRGCNRLWTPQAPPQPQASPQNFEPRKQTHVARVQGCQQIRIHHVAAPRRIHHACTLWQPAEQLRVQDAPASWGDGSGCV